MKDGKIRIQKISFSDETESGRVPIEIVAECSRCFRMATWNLDINAGFLHFEAAKRSKTRDGRENLIFSWFASEGAICEICQHEKGI